MFIPLFQKNGVNPWIAVFVINTIGRVWFFEYQEPEYAIFTKNTKNFSLDMSGVIKKTRIRLNIFYIISIYVGIYYWKLIGILPW